MDSALDQGDLIDPMATSAGGLLDRDAVPGLRLIAQLGRGARAVVYRAQRGAAEYAVKLLHPAAGESEAAAFVREGALLAALEHPGLPRIHEVGWTADRPYLVMDLIAGGSLARLVDSGPLDEARAVALATQVASALEVAHRAGLVHRDVKPDNIMIASDGTARVIDFGLAVRAGAEQEDRAVGTFLYSAPEQTGMLHRAVDGRADLYALGVVLFECLTGQVPFTADDVGELIRLHLAAPAPDIRSLRPDASAAVAAVVARLLAKDPDDRYQTARGLVTDLGRIAAGERGAFALGGGDVAAVDGTGFIGRGSELDRLRDRWQAAAGGRGGLVVVAGRAGAGKSRLVRQLTGSVQAGDGLVLTGKCLGDGAIPLAPLREAVEAHLRSIDLLDEPDRRRAWQRIRDAAGDAAGSLTALSPALAALAPDSREATHDVERRFSESVAELLTALAHAEGGLLLHLDDLQWCDQATRQVLRQLATLLPTAPLLVVGTVRDDPAGPDDPPWSDADLDDAALRITLDALDGPAVAALAASQLGTGALPPGLVPQLVARTDGNPLGVLEYLRSVLDAGLLRPSWGEWLLDDAGLVALDLPENVMELVLRRIDRLGAETRTTLAAAAVVGNRFTVSLVAAVLGIDPVTAGQVFVDATAHQLVEPIDGGGFRFLHDRVREALLSGLSEHQVRALHQAIAEALDSGPATGGPDRPDDDRVYAVARHYLRGDTTRAPDRVYRAAAAAGSLALARHAPAEAIDLLSRAEEVARAAGLPTTVELHADLGTAASRTGRFPLAQRQLARALEIETDRFRRAGLYAALAEAHYGPWEGDKAIEMVRRGLAELGHPQPSNPFLLAVTTLVSLLAGIVVGWLPARWRSVSGPKREEYRLRAHLSHIGAGGAVRAVRGPLVAVFQVRALYLAKRLGPGPEYAMTFSGLSIVAMVAGRPRTAARLISQAIAAAESDGDPRLVAHMHWMHGLAFDEFIPTATDGTSGRHLQRMLETYRRSIDVDEYLTGAAVVGKILMLRGYSDQAGQWYRRGLSRAPSAGEVLSNPFATLGPMAAALDGRPAEAAAELREVQDYLATHPDNRALAVAVGVARVVLAVEQGEEGEVLERALADFAALRLKPAMVWTAQRVFWVHQAFARLAQLRTAPADRRAERLAQARQAVRQLRRAIKGDVLRGYHRTAEASLCQLGGDHRGALRRLAKLESWAGGLDAPLLGFEAARIRARAQHALGNHPDGNRQARLAFSLAAENGWAGRARSVRAEFDLEGPLGHSAPTASGRRELRTSDRPPTGRGTNELDRAGGVDLHNRRLGALHEVSIAAATVLDPAELARVALDEIVRIFAAERAFLFLREEGPDGQLRPYRGRDDRPADIAEFTGFAATLVERVDASGEALVVTGSEQGAALGSQSAMVHGLRSIMVAPLIFKGRVLGVVYLDSRLARGIFTTDDVDILVAIANHVALAMETARTAQLDLAVHAARRERDLAETLRQAMSELAGTLDLDEVHARFLAAVTRVLPVDTAVLLRSREHDRRLAVAAVHGPTGVGTADPDPAADTVLADLLDATEPRRGAPTDGPAPLVGVLGADPAGWLAVPWRTHGQGRGLLLIANAARPYTDAEVQIAAAIAGHGMMALDNAMLFEQVNRLAERDSLTGLYNRRRFAELATGQLATAPGAAAVMVDIDHFKAINDTHGHRVGDQVIQAVADRLSGRLRADDIICRYGGEEFAILLTDTPMAEAARVAEQLHAAVTSEPVPTDTGPIPVTVSVGLAEPGGGQADLQSLLNVADGALYQAKRAGRDRICTATG